MIVWKGSLHLVGDPCFSKQDSGSRASILVMLNVGKSIEAARQYKKSFNGQHACRLIKIRYQSAHIVKKESLPQLAGGIRSLSRC